MQLSKSSSGQLRYRLYFWMMDASLIGVIIFFASVIFQTLTEKVAFGLPPLASSILGMIVLLLILPLPLVVIIAKPLRDEYASLLWQRTIGPLVVFMSTTPLIFFTSLWVFYAISVDPKEVPALSWLYDEQSYVEAVTGAWLIFNMLFVLIFQFIRWRDSRG